MPVASYPEGEFERPPMYHRDVDRLMFSTPEARLRMPYPEDYDFEYIHPGRTHPGIYDPYQNQFDGGYASYYESPYMYSRGIEWNDLPAQMPSARNLEKYVDKEGLIRVKKSAGYVPAPGAPPGRPYQAAKLTTYKEPRVNPERSNLRSMDDEFHLREQNSRLHSTKHRSGWQNHFEDDHAYWKGTPDELYRVNAPAQGGSRESRLSPKTMTHFLHCENHGGPSRSMFGAQGR